MPDALKLRAIERIVKQIDAIAQKKNNLTLADLRETADLFRPLGVLVEERPTAHGVLLQMGNEIAHVATHNRGNKQLKSYTVSEFVKRARAAIARVNEELDQAEDPPIGGAEKK